MKNYDAIISTWLEMTSLEKLGWLGCAATLIAKRNGRACCAAWRQLPTPIVFTLTVALSLLLILPNMPLHPLSIPASLGGGVSISICVLTISWGQHDRSKSSF
jgi:hypothetical protein